MRGNARTDKGIDERRRCVKKRDAKRIERERPAGIVIHDVETTDPKPLIRAFIWGGKVRPEPTLPFGRWKPTAA